MTEKNLLKKIDPRGRSLVETRSLPTGTEVLLRLEGPLSEDQERELCDAGWTGRSCLGNVASGVVQSAAGLEAIAGLGFVKQIHVSTALFDEPEDRRKEP